LKGILFHRVTDAAEVMEMLPILIDEAGRNSGFVIQ
jgi:hypothetical protein